MKDSVFNAKPEAYSYIRWSSEGQSDGDSQRRQTAPTLELCERKGWNLNTSLRLIDSGISAFKGKHRTIGALAGFLKAIEAGTVRKGSWLIVEALDRLSREEITDALNLFLSITRAGVGIYTLMDEKQYTRESLNQNPHELMYTIALMAAAHEYSAKLSKRVQQARSSAIDKAAKGCRDAIHGRPPYWMDWQDHKYVLNPERVAIVRQMIGWTLDGLGCIAIARRLSAARVPCRSAKKKDGSLRRWDDTTVRTILINRALIGEYQPQRIIEKDGKKTRSNVGEVLRNYYPAIISEDEFLKIKASMATRARHITGRTGQWTNIFGSGLLKSGHDGSSMIIVTKENQKGRHYVCLASSDSVHGQNNQKTPTLSANYVHIESTFLYFVREITLEPVKAESSPLDLFKGQLADVQKRILRVQGELEGDGDFDAGWTLLKRLEAQKKEIQASIDAEAAKLNTPTVTTRDVGELGELLANAENKGDLRVKLKMAVAQIVKGMTLWVYAEGIRRVAVVRVVFHGGSTRTFAVRTERGKPVVRWTDGLGRRYHSKTFSGGGAHSFRNDPIAPEVIGKMLLAKNVPTHGVRHGIALAERVEAA